MNKPDEFRNSAEAAWSFFCDSHATYKKEREVLKMSDIFEKPDPTNWENEDQERLANQIIDLLVGEMTYGKARTLIRKIDNELEYLHSIEKVSRS